MATPILSRPATLVAGLGLSVLVVAGVLVMRRPSGTRQWTPDDHDQPQGVMPLPSAPTPRAEIDLSVLGETTWTARCAPCHGPNGQGDGPEGPMLHAPDLTRADWQARTSDDAIAEVIRKGRNRMPPTTLPPRTVEALVKRVRAHKAQ